MRCFVAKVLSRYLTVFAQNSGDSVLLISASCWTDRAVCLHFFHVIEHIEDMLLREYFDGIKLKLEDIIIKVAVYG